MKKTVLLLSIFFCLIVRPAYGVIQNEEIKLSSNSAMINEKKEKIFKIPIRISGKITAVKSSQLTVSSDDKKIYQVNIFSQTHLRRKFWGTSKLSEFSVGDQVKVLGRLAVNSSNTINAVIIRNLSIERRWGAYFGEIIKKNETNFIIKTEKRGELTVEFTIKTKFVSRENIIIDYQEVEIGNRVRIKGIWDSKINNITEVDQVKDFSLPVISPTP